MNYKASNQYTTFFFFWLLTGRLERGIMLIIIIILNIHRLGNLQLCGS